MFDHGDGVLLLISFGFFLSPKVPVCSHPSLKHSSTTLQVYPNEFEQIQVSLLCSSWSRVAFGKAAKLMSRRTPSPWSNKVCSQQQNVLQVKGVE